MLEFDNNVTLTGLSDIDLTVILLLIGKYRVFARFGQNIVNPI